MVHNVLVTGANGQLGHCLQNAAADYTARGWQFFYTDVDTLDITDIEQILKAVEEHHIDLIINTAAYTNVDQAESDEAAARTLNATAVGHLAAVAKEKNLLLIHISTDYVFDGKSTTPYKTDHPYHPVSVYGITKAEGEKAIMESGCRSVIVRTAWLYSEYGNHNFVKTMIRLGQERNELKVVNDKKGAPTYAPDLAKVLLMLADKYDGQGLEIFHFANEGEITWFDLATEIMRIAHFPCKVFPITSDQYPSPAERPDYSVFDLSKIKKYLSISIPDWKESLQKCVHNYGF